uniref:Pentatricopeptide repeat-containing protein At1g31430 family n=1 Tax=Cajanus cajan TaxID=3821 RepID=A0A151U407_CAJCA|nr:Pentatricopeptide repeat-containing protein At1g31430 family [Cajanus cajan]
MSQLKQIQAHVFCIGLQQDRDTLNKLMAFSMDSSLGDFNYANRIFNHIHDPSLFIYNLMIKAFVKRGSFCSAISLFHQLREHGVWPDNYTYPYVLKGIVCTREVRKGENIHAFVVKTGLEFDPYVCNSLMDMYAKLGLVEEFCQVFEEIPERDSVSWNIMISGYVKCRRFQEAIDVHRRMRMESNKKPNLEIFDAMTMKNVNCWTNMVTGSVICEAIALFGEMQIRGVKLDKFIVVTLLTSCAQSGAPEQGKWIHNYIDENRITVDVVVGTALIEMYAKCGCIEISLEIFHGLKEKDTASWTSIICGLAMNGRTSEALELFEAMQTCGLKPDDVTFIAVLSACSHAGLVEEGRKLFHSMSSIYHIEPNLEHYGCFIDLLNQAGLLQEAKELVKKLLDQKDEVIVPLNGALLSACRIYGNIDMGERLATMLAKVKSSDSSLHSLLASIYASADRWKDVRKVRSNMKNLGIKKVPGYSAIGIEVYGKGGNSGGVGNLSHFGTKIALPTPHR